MPLIVSKTVFENAKLGIWDVKEASSYFMHHLKLEVDEIKLIEAMSAKKRIEWLSSRYLVHLMSERKDRASILKDEYGKPFIKESDHYISFSHSGDLSASIFSLKVVGIDIQVIVRKITRIAKKFVSDQEFEIINKHHSKYQIELLHIIWGAKESLYKAYGRRGLDLKKDMSISEFEWNGKCVQFSGNVVKEKYSARFSIFAEKINQYILVYAEQI